MLENGTNLTEEEIAELPRKVRQIRDGLSAEQQALFDAMVAEILGDDVQGYMR